MLEQVATAVEHAESRGNWLARNGSHIGLMQIGSRWSQWPTVLLYLPAVNRWEGRRLLRYWHGRAGGDWVRAVAAYRCGNGGLRLRCGKVYALAVLARGGVR